MNFETVFFSYNNLPIHNMADGGQNAQALDDVALSIIWSVT